MTYNQMIETVKAAYAKFSDDYMFVGIRFENKLRGVGDICENSMHNPDREDEREFPEYDTDDYWKMTELDGTSAWDAEHYSRFAPKGDSEGLWNGNHCYIVAGDSEGGHPDPDANEILIRKAEVVKVLW